MKTVVVVGGGITGLCMMHYVKKQLQEKNVEARLVLIEKNSYLGGKIHSEHVDGFIMETGNLSKQSMYQKCWQNT